MAVISKMTFDNGSTKNLIGSTFYGKCTTAAGTAAKTVTIGGWTESTKDNVSGTTVHIYFVNGNSENNLTLNVDGQGAHPIYIDNDTKASTFSAGVYTLTLTQFVIMGQATWCWLMGAKALSAITADSADSVPWSGVTGKPSLDFIPTSQKGANSGVATLDASGKVPSSQLPSYVDDVLEYASRSLFPSTGTSGIIYIAADTNLTYRWSGSNYVEISPSLALGTTHATAAYGDEGATAYAHATDSGRLTTATSSGLYKVSVTAQGHVGSATAVTKSDITALGIPGDSGVTSVTIKGTSPITIDSETAITTTGTRTISLANSYGDTKNPYAAKVANTVLAGPASGNDAAPTFRQLVAADIPLLTKSKISDFPTSMTPTSHSHGNIDNVGAITPTATIASGDRLVIADKTDGYTATGSSIEFGSATDTYLRNNGTWGTPPVGSNVPNKPTTSGTYSLNITSNGASWTAVAPSGLQPPSSNGHYILGVNGNSVTWESSPDLYAIEQLSGTSGILKKTAADTWTLDTTTYLASSAISDWAKASTKPSYALNEIDGTQDLRKIEALADSSTGFLKKTAANTWALDSTTYATSSDISSAINALDGSITGSAAANKTLTAFSQANGIVTAEFGDISITKSQVSDFPSSMPASDVSAWAKAASKPSYSLTEIDGTQDLRKIEALSDSSTGFLKKTAANTWALDNTTYATAANITSAIEALDGSITGTPGASKTLTAFSETDGIITATFGDISITKSQISDFPTSMTPTAHNHGSINSYGQIDTTATIGTSDKLAIIDYSAENAVKASSISFSSSGTGFLKENGTWGTPINTTYTLSTGDANGQIKVTPSSGNAYNVDVKGLGSNAYTSTAYIPTSQKGANSGVAELDANGKVPSSQLPSYVDDVINGFYHNSKFYEDDEYTHEITGETGKIYIDVSSNKTYRWSGNGYTEISASLALGETSSTAYRGDKGATAYSHATDSSRLTTAQSSGLYKFATTAEGHIASVTAVQKSDITGLGIPAQDTTYTFDGTYNASTNKAATVKTVTDAIGALDGSVSGSAAANKTLTSFSQTNGVVTAKFEDISITKSQVSDFPASMPASDVSAWAKAATKPAYALSELTGASDVQAIEALTGTSGFLKKTAADTWSLDTTSYLPTTGGNVTGDITLLKQVSSGAPGDSYGLIFQRGTLTDNYNDWMIKDSGGYLHFYERGSGSTAWNDRVLFNTTGGIVATGQVQANSLASTSFVSVGSYVSIGSTCDVATGDALVVGDSSDSNRVKRSNVTFGTSTDTFLRNDGTWATPSGGGGGGGSDVPNKPGNDGHYMLQIASGTATWEDAPDLWAIEGLSGTTGLLKKTAANTWTLDTTSYLASSAISDWAKAATKPSYALSELTSATDVQAIEELSTTGLLRRVGNGQWETDSTTYLPSSQKGAANGVAELDTNSKVPVTQTHYLFGKCNTASSTVEKAVSITGFATSVSNIESMVGITVFVAFAQTNTASSATLNVNSTAAYPIVAGSYQDPVTVNRFSNGVHAFTLIKQTGEYYWFINEGRDTIPEAPSAAGTYVINVDSFGSTTWSSKTIPAVPTTGSLTLTTSGWTETSGVFSKTVTISGSTANSKIDLQPSATVITQMVEDGITALYIENNNGTLTAYAIGATPTASMTIQYMRTEVTT